MVPVGSMRLQQQGGFLSDFFLSVLAFFSGFFLDSNLAEVGSNFLTFSMKLTAWKICLSIGSKPWRSISFCHERGVPNKVTLRKVHHLRASDCCCKEANWAALGCSNQGDSGRECEPQWLQAQACPDALLVRICAEGHWSQPIPMHCAICTVKECKSHCTGQTAMPCHCRMPVAWGAITPFDCGS